MNFRPALLAFGFTVAILGWLAALGQGVGAVWSALHGQPWWVSIALLMVALGTLAALRGIVLQYPRSTCLGLITLYAGGFAMGFAAGVFV